MAKFNTVPMAPKSQYELERDARIERNERFLASLSIGDAKISAIQQRKREKALEEQARLRAVKSKEDWDRHLQWLLERPARRPAAVKAAKAVKRIAGAEASRKVVVSQDVDFEPVGSDVDSDVESAPVKKKKKAPRVEAAPATTLKPTVALAMALKYGHRSTLVLRCLGAKDRRWDGSRPVNKARVPEVACGYPKGTHKKSPAAGACMFLRATPSKKGIYTIPKIVYEPTKKPKANNKKTGEVVHYRLVEESDVEAIKKAFNLVF